MSELSLLTVFDIDLPLANRTQANLWKAKYVEALRELQKANKGLRRLSKRNTRPQSDLRERLEKLGNEFDRMHKQVDSRYVAERIFHSILGEDDE